MAKRSVSVTTKPKVTVKWEFPLEKNNLIIIGIGLAVILVGYLLMATGITEEPAIANGTWDNTMAVSVAPILLVIGYIVIIPYGIIKRFNKVETK